MITENNIKEVLSSLQEEDVYQAYVESGAYNKTIQEYI